MTCNSKLWSKDKATAEDGGFPVLEVYNTSGVVCFQKHICISKFKSIFLTWTLKNKQKRKQPYTNTCIKNYNALFEFSHSLTVNVSDF